MQPSRRDFLRAGVGSSTLLACGLSVPTFLARTANAFAGSPASGGRVLVVLQLDGGNDGLNTVVPYGDDNYRKHRPHLQVAKNQVLRIDDHMGLHPALTGLSPLLQKGQLAVVQSVGYPNPNRSHFESMAIWHAGRLQPEASKPGWLARALDEGLGRSGGDAAALHISSELLPHALYGSQRQVPSLLDLERFRRRVGVPESAGAAEQRAALDQVAALDRGGPGSLLQFVQRSTVLSYTSSARLEDALHGQKPPSGYPDNNGLAQRFKLIAQLIKAGLGTSIYYTRFGGFDTHANQQGTHFGLLREMGDALKAFLDDLTASGDSRRVLVLVFSEFGRRLTENASGGTDHGTAAPVLLLGGVRPGLHGPYPNLTDLADGDPRHAIDFRQVYATVLDRWLACPAQGVLGEKFEHLPVLVG
ncbi:MAG TPA: DUF1501 domain-containing protein [Gemmataceae bacterium]|nr:DUF1501 domain-containing protein [Gemmataceae bacterium]